MTEALARGEKPDPNDPADRAAAVRDYVLRTGVMPDARVREFRGGLLSDNSAAQVFAARQIAALEKENPALVADIPQEGRMRARTIAAFALPSRVFL